MNPTDNNPLLAPWTGPYRGVPPFDAVEVKHFKPALKKGMEEMSSSVRAIVENPEPPTFENTIEALEGAGRTLERVAALYSVWSSSLSSPAFQVVEREMSPWLTGQLSRIRQDADLFRRIEVVYEGSENAGLTAEQRRLAWRYHSDHLRAGARLEAEPKARVAAISERLAVLFTEFNNNVLADDGEAALIIDDEAGLAGLPASFRVAAREAAAEQGLEDRWLIVNTRSSVEPFLENADRRDLREQVWRAFVTRGDMGGDTDNNAIITEILALRAERAALLGYETHAHMRVENQMAKTPEAVLELLRAVWDPAVARAREEVADMQAVVDAEGGGFRIEPWDHRYYSEKVRAARYDLDQDEVAGYLQLDRLRDAMFWVSESLFGLAFRPAENVPLFHSDMEVWEVTEGATGRSKGLFYFDPFARKGKRSGAWMTHYRSQERFEEEVTTLVSNNSNFVRGRPGEPVLISWTDATTLFHEFGHALNGLASDVAYPTLAGTPSERDYVEFPSQLFEHWLSTPEVLNRFALHHETGEPMPAEIVERLKRAENFNQGFATVEYLANALLDMELHLADGEAVDPGTFEREALERIGMPREIAMRHRLPHFAHAFGSDGYSAGYYGYLWADVLTADGWEAFQEGEGPFDRAVARSLYDEVLSTGGAVEPAEAYRAFRGHDARVEALMRKRGFSAPLP